MGIHAKTKEEKYSKILEIKKSMETEKLLHNGPKELIDYLNYCKQLQYEQDPDYNYLISLFKDLVTKTIKENIELYSKLSDKDVNKAIDLASARNFVDSLPNGIHERAYERGENFSIGQKQLIAFARIFALNLTLHYLN